MNAQKDNQTMASDKDKRWCNTETSQMFQNRKKNFKKLKNIKIKIKKILKKI
jgi:hypothetical protein